MTDGQEGAPSAKKPKRKGKPQDPAAGPAKKPAPRTRKKKAVLSPQESPPDSAAGPAEKPAPRTRKKKAALSPQESPLDSAAGPAEKPAPRTRKKKAALPQPVQESPPDSPAKNLGASPEAYGGTGSVRSVAIHGRHGGRPSSNKDEASFGGSDPQEMDKTFPPARIDFEKCQPAAAVKPAAARMEMSGRPLVRFQRMCRGILQEVAPELLNWAQDRRKRRRAIKKFLLRRSSQGQRKGGDSRDPGNAGSAGGRASSPARALPKLAFLWARRVRIAAWRGIRPILRWQRRSSPVTILATYFGLLSVLSLLASAYFLIPARHVDHPPKAEAPPHLISMQLGVPARKALQQPQEDPVSLTRLQKQAEEEFLAGNYAAAEQIFRELLPTARFRALTGFQIYLCLLKQNKSAEAELMAGRFPTGPMARNPSGIYVRAAAALLQGRTEDARAAIESARKQYPQICPLYDKALSDAALAPLP